MDHLRIVHVTDLHLTEGPRLAEAEAELDRIATVSAAVHPDLVAITGDLYGRTVPHRSTPAERRVLFAWVARMAALAPVVILAGNHDYPGDLEPLTHIGGGHPVHVVESARRIQFSDVEVLAMPYPGKAGIAALVGEGLGEVSATVDDVVSRLLRSWRVPMGNPSLRVFLGHFTVRGTRLSGGEVLATVEPQVNAADLVELGVCAGLLGHIHLPDSPAPGFWYGGSPWQSDHGEAPGDSGWMVWDIARAGAEDPRPPTGESWGIGRTERDGWVTHMWRIPSQAPALRTVRFELDEHGACVQTSPESDAEDSHVRIVLRYRATLGGSPALRSAEDALRARFAGRNRSVRIDREPIAQVRTRAPQIAAAETTTEKLEAWAAMQDPQPDPETVREARALLAELESAP